MFQTYTGWQGNKIMTTVSSTGLPVRFVPFPAVTICALGSSDVDMAAALVRQVGTAWIRPIVFPQINYRKYPCKNKASF